MEKLQSNSIITTTILDKFLSPLKFGLDLLRRVSTDKNTFEIDYRFFHILLQMSIWHHGSCQKLQFGLWIWTKQSKLRFLELKLKRKNNVVGKVIVLWIRTMVLSITIIGLAVEREDSTTWSGVLLYYASYTAALRGNRKAGCTIPDLTVEFELRCWIMENKAFVHMLDQKMPILREGTQGIRCTKSIYI